MSAYGKLRVVNHHGNSAIVPLDGRTYEWTAHGTAKVVAGDIDSLELLADAIESEALRVRNAIRARDAERQAREQAAGGDAS